MWVGVYVCVWVCMLGGDLDTAIAKMIRKGPLRHQADKLDVCQ